MAGASDCVRGSSGLGNWSDVESPPRERVGSGTRAGVREWTAVDRSGAVTRLPPRPVCGADATEVIRTPAVERASTGSESFAGTDDREGRSDPRLLSTATPPTPTPTPTNATVVTAAFVDTPARSALMCDLSSTRAQTTPRAARRGSISASASERRARVRRAWVAGLVIPSSVAISLGGTPCHSRRTIARRWFSGIDASASFSPRAGPPRRGPAWRARSCRDRRRSSASLGGRACGAASGRRSLRSW